MSGIMMGTYYHNMDAKGRVNFPAKLRETLGDAFIVARGRGERHLSVYTKEYWEGICEQAAGFAGTNGENIRRWLNSSATEVVTDKQGRILLPKELREFAGLNKDVVIIGAGTKAEIWNQEDWDKVNSSFDPASVPELEALCL